MGSFYQLKEIIEDNSIPRDQITKVIVERFAKQNIYINADVPKWETKEERNQYMRNLKVSGYSADEVGKIVGLQKSQVREIIYSSDL